MTRQRTIITTTYPYTKIKMISLLSSLSDITFLGIPLINVSGLAEMLIRFALNAVFVYIIVNFFYYPRARRRDYYFAFVMLSVSIFMMIYLMDGSKIKIGAALGLFAVFGIIRYRTESVPIREMTCSSWWPSPSSTV